MTQNCAHRSDIKFYCWKQECNGAPICNDCMCQHATHVKISLPIIEDLFEKHLKSFESRKVELLQSQTILIEQIKSLYLKVGKILENLYRVNEINDQKNIIGLLKQQGGRPNSRDQLAAIRQMIDYKSHNGRVQFFLSCAEANRFAPFQQELKNIKQKLHQTIEIWQTSSHFRMLNLLQTHKIESYVNPVSVGNNRHVVRFQALRNFVLLGLVQPEFRSYNIIGPQAQDFTLIYTVYQFAGQNLQRLQQEQFQRSQLKPHNELTLCYQINFNAALRIQAQRRYQIDFCTSHPTYVVAFQTPLNQEFIQIEQQDNGQFPAFLIKLS